MSAPSDWMNPNWEKTSKVHDWKNYASGSVKKHWDSFYNFHKEIIAECLQGIADQEEWD